MHDISLTKGREGGSSDTDLPTYPAPTQQIFLTAAGAFSLRSKFVGTFLIVGVGVPALARMPSKASRSCIGCSRGEKERLPSGVVGAVLVSMTDSSESATVDGVPDIFSGGFGLSLLL